MCYLTRCILGVHVGGRSADDLKGFLKSFPQAQGRITFTDDLAAYAAVLPKGAHFTGKMHTQRLESLNANVRHHLARFRRKTRCTTKCLRMAYLSALLFMQAHNKKLFG
ncbi:MAG: IS1 family transposase [Geminicoccaceae bacterium]|nr:IS1 family transposase [Geminicoccaceae bacterium]